MEIIKRIQQNHLYIDEFFYIDYTPICIVPICLFET